MTDDPERLPGWLRFYATYGEFIHQFTMTEQRLQDILWVMTGMDVETVRAVVGENRYGNIVDAINRLTVSRNEAEDAAYRKAINHLGMVNRTRNLLVHTGSSFVGFAREGDERISYGALMLYNGEKGWQGRKVQVGISYLDLEEMIADLETINALLTTFIMRKYPDHPAHLKVTPHQRTQVAETAARPWRHKPPAQSGKKAARRKLLQEPLPPPPPSKE